MYERIETTNAPAQQVNPRYAHRAKGGPRRAAASAEKGICLMRDAIRGHHQRSSHTSEKGICLRAERRGQSVSINRTRAGGAGREWHTNMPELAVINRYQSLSNRHPSGMPELAVLDLRLLRGDGIDELPRKEPRVPE